MRSVCRCLAFARYPVIKAVEAVRIRPGNPEVADVGNANIQVRRVAVPDSQPRRLCCTAVTLRPGAVFPGSADSSGSHRTAYP